MPVHDKYKLGKLYKMILAQLSVINVNVRLYVNYNSFFNNTFLNSYIDWFNKSSTTNKSTVTFSFSSHKNLSGNSDLVKDYKQTMMTKPGAICTTL